MTSAVPWSHIAGRGRPARSPSLQLLAIVVLALAASGCSIKFGFMPETDRLAELSIGQSRQGDVLLVLGQPRGKGAAHVKPERGRSSASTAPAFERRDIWFYEYVESDGQSVRVKMLLVFFDGDVYDGHFWFSAVEEESS